jgi:hypothetical protein
MLGYLSKFVLQMLPTIAATVIGAYIVTTWINPKTPPESAKIAAGASRQQTAKVAYPAGQPAQDAAAQPAETVPTGADAQAKAASAPDTVRIIPIVKQPQSSPETAVSVLAATPPVIAATADERSDANALARAAIQRQRSGAEAPRAADEPSRPVAPAVRPQQTRSAPEGQPPAVATVAPPLPPAVTIAPLRSPQAEAGDQVASERPTPPAEIPQLRNPLSLHASHRVAENPSPADDFLNATRSFFRALTPQ